MDINGNNPSFGDADSGKKVLKYVAFIALALLILVCPLAIVSSYFVPTPTPPVTDAPTIIVSPTFTLTYTNTPAPTFTPTFTPMIDPPKVPTFTFTPTAPAPIKVSTWHDDSSDCYSENNDKWVLVSGVEISGGVPPYMFKFEQFGQVLAEATVSPIGGRVTFDPEILVNKGAYVRVTINSSTQTLEPNWDSGLFYKLYPVCD